MRLSFNALSNQLGALGANFICVKIKFKFIQVKFSHVSWESLEMNWLEVISDQNKVKFFQAFSWFVKLEKDSNFLLMLWQRKEKRYG